MAISFRQAWRGPGAVFLGDFIAFARWRALGAGLLIALGAVFDGLGLLLLVPVLELVVGPHAGGRLGAVLQGLLGRYPPSQRLIVLLTGFALVMAVRGMVLRRRDRATHALQLGFVEAVRLRLVGRLASAGWPAMAGSSHARILQALSVEIHQVGVASASALLAGVALVMLAGHAVLALALAPAAGAAAMAFALAGGLIGQAYLMRSRALGRSIIEAHVNMAETAAGFLGGLKLALAQGLEGRFVQGYASASAEVARDRLDFQDLQSSLRNLISGTAALLGAVTVFAGVEVFHLAAPVLITLLVILSRMGGYASTAQHGIQQITHSLPAFGAIRALENELEHHIRPPASRPAMLAPVSPDAALAFSRVAFSHGAEGGREVLSEASVTIPAGAFVGVVGPSGAGKTTFLDLAAGVLRPRAGAVFAFGRELAGDVLEAHRQGLAYVAQDAFLFDGTVRANLDWSAPGRSETEMLDALERSGASDLIGRLGQGLDTRIGHRGVLVSAGERQRLAIAGALLRRPRLLLMDEATNAIDIEGEAAILASIAALTPRTTVLLAAHRSESLRLCDHILDLPAVVLRTSSPARSRPVREAS
jgi:ATP-binding cassette subfamily C protein